MTRMTVDTGTQAARLRALADPAPGRVLYVLAVLGAADRLAFGAASTVDLADAVGADADALRRVLRVAADLDLVAPAGEDTWILRPAGHLLRSDVPGSMRAELADNDLYSLWSGFLHSVRTGEACYPQVFGASMFDRLTATPAARRAFHRHMYERAYEQYTPLLDLPAWPAAGQVVDVAGGTGGLLGALLAGRPALHGVLHDLPEVLAMSPLRDHAELGGRVSFADADMFRDPLPDGDVYVLASVLHDWPDGPAATVLRRCRPTAGRAYRVLVVDRIAPDAGPSPVFCNDLLMLAAVGGRERNLAQWLRLLRAAGLDLVTVTGDPRSELSVLECAPR